jgi:hypothetical protein
MLTMKVRAEGTPTCPLPLWERERSGARRPFIVRGGSTRPMIVSREITQDPSGGSNPMKQFLAAALSFASLVGVPAMADNDSLDAAVGSAVGGGLGALLGNEAAGRNGAIVGGALGAATGAAVATQNDRRPRYDYPPRYYSYPPTYRSFPPGPPGPYFCPPGQAKKGRCN